MIDVRSEFLGPLCESCGVRHHPEDCPAFIRAAREAGPAMTSEAIFRAERGRAASQPLSDAEK